jgi:hypothetical protein
VLGAGRQLLLADLQHEAHIAAKDKAPGNTHLGRAKNAHGTERRESAHKQHGQHNPQRDSNQRAEQRPHDGTGDFVLADSIFRLFLLLNVAIQHAHILLSMRSVRPAD